MCSIKEEKLCAAPLTVEIQHHYTQIQIIDNDVMAATLSVVKLLYSIGVKKSRAIGVSCFKVLEFPNDKFFEPLCCEGKAAHLAGGVRGDAQTSTIAPTGELLRPLRIALKYSSQT
jgi:hypothetical protein